MKVQCDKCGTIFSEPMGTRITRAIILMGQERDLYICTDCLEKLNKWIDEKGEIIDN